MHDSERELNIYGPYLPSLVLIYQVELSDKISAELKDEQEGIEDLPDDVKKKSRSSTAFKSMFHSSCREAIKMMFFILSNMGGCVH